MVGLGYSEAMENPRWLDLLLPLGTFVVGADVLIAPFDYAKYPKNTKSKVYVPHAIVRPDDSLLLVAQVLGSYLVVDNTEETEEEEDADYTQGYLICGWIEAGKWLWADPAKRATAAAATEPVGVPGPVEEEDKNVVKFSPRDG